MITMMRTPFILLYLSVLLILNAQQSGYARVLSSEKQIVSRIFNNYDAYVRPPIRDHAQHTSVVVMLSVFIDRINWDDNYAMVNLYLRQQWEDSRLMFDVAGNDEIDEILVPMNKRTWMPDTYFSNGDDKRHSERKRIVVEPTGYIRSSEMRTVTVPFKYDDKFPLRNTKAFSLKISNYNHPVEDIVYVWANSPPFSLPVEISTELKESKYGFEKAIAGSCVGNFTVGVYSCIDVLITFRSSSHETIFQLFIPSVLLVISSWFHFWIHGSWSVPRTASAALPFAIFIIMHLFYSKHYLGTEATCAIQVWLFFCALITFASFAEYFLVICCGIIRRQVNLQYKDERNSEEAADKLNNDQMLQIDYNTKCTPFINRSGFDIVSRIAFPIVFFVFLAIYLIIYRF